eukprot:TRINITY_DN760_c0_g3_i1.p1 TRINITY_DN760_c0_g3~~TRINITY_DN760_c0_g3_i1.p1  ORF type:complete len:135 (-),score=38.37 TRINITY_DN760_c0_g3_i1:52-411(-)
MATEVSASKEVKRLMEAESIAKKKIEDAKRERQKEQAKARGEAEAEIAKFKSQLEAEYSKSAAAEGAGDFAAKLEADTVTKVKEIHNSSKAKRDEVIRILLAAVSNVTLDIEKGRQKAK